MDSKTIDLLLSKIDHLEKEVETLKEEKNRTKQVSDEKIEQKQVPKKEKSYDDLLETFNDYANTPFKSSQQSQPKVFPHNFKDMVSSLINWQSRASLSSYKYCRLKLWNIPKSIYEYTIFAIPLLLMCFDVILYVITFIPIRALYFIFIYSPYLICRYLYMKCKSLFTEIKKKVQSNKSHDIHRSNSQKSNIHGISSPKHTQGKLNKKGKKGNETIFSFDESSISSFSQHSKSHNLSEPNLSITSLKETVSASKRETNRIESPQQSMTNDTLHTQKTSKDITINPSGRPLSSSTSLFSPSFSAIKNPVQLPPLALSNHTNDTSVIYEHIEERKQKEKIIGFMFDCIRLFLVLVTVLYMNRINISFIYHYIKSQTHFKLFIIIGFTDVVAALFSKTEHEFCNTLYMHLRNIVFEHESRAKNVCLLLIDLLFACLNEIVLGLDLYIYFMCNCIMMSTEDDTFYSLSLITNFKDIRKQVFKKTDEVGLFYVAVREVICMFYLILALCLSLLLYYCTEENIKPYIELSINVIILETVADWIKHAFTCKQNNINPKMYRNFTVLFNRDYIASYIDNYFDPSHMISDRMGLGILGVSALILRVCIQYLPSVHPLIYLLVFLNIIAFKLLLSSFFLIVAYKNHKPVPITNIFNQVINVDNIMNILNK
ncbi:hypothetical protein WA158_008326 [Blastocystis sp. Blastoise]